VLSIRVVTVSQRPDCLIVYLGCGDNPEYKAGVGFTINGIYQVDGFDSEECFTAACGDFKAKAGKRPSESVTA